jgi:hypothetical protein
MPAGRSAAGIAAIIPETQTLHCVFGRLWLAGPASRCRHRRANPALAARAGRSIRLPVPIHDTRPIMQVPKILIATLIAASAVGAMSQELDPGETLQAKNLAAPRLQSKAPTTPSLAPVAAAVRDVQPVVQAQAGVAAAPDTSWAARHFAKAYSKRWLHGDKPAVRAVVVGEAN